MFSGFSPWFMRFWWLLQHTTAISAISIPYVQDMSRHGGAGTGDHWAPSCSGVEPTKPTSADAPGVWGHQTIRTKLNKQTFAFDGFQSFHHFWWFLISGVWIGWVQRTGRFLPFFLGWFFSRQNIHSVSTPAASLSELGRKLLLSARRGKSDSLWSLPFFLGRVLLESYWSV